jgi:hypothetical protein
MEHSSAEPSLLEIILFHTVAFQTVPADILAHNAMMRHSTPLPLETWEALVASCIDKGWLRCLDDSTLAEIRNCLTGVELVCDAEAIPRVGDMDFTLLGTQVYKADLLGSPEPWWKDRLDAPSARVVSRTDPNHCEVEVYMIQPASVTDALYRMREGWAHELARCPVVSSTPPEGVGPWCSRWWNQHPAGYRLTAVICQPVQSVGPGGEGEPAAAADGPSTTS